MQEPQSSVPKLYIQMSGPSVGEARLAALDMAEIIRRTQQALKRVGQVLFGEASIGKGRKKKEIEDLCELFVVGWKPGSTVAVLELADPPAQLSLFGHIGEQSMEAFVKGINTISSQSVTPSELPTGFDTGVLQTCAELGRVFEHGIDKMTYSSVNGRAFEHATYDTAVRKKVRNLLGQPVALGKISKIGRLEVLNGHGKVAGTLWEADGTRWVCHFKDEHLEILPDAWMRAVKVTGSAIVEEGRERTLEVDSLLVTDEEIMTHYEAAEAAPFWKSMSLDELAEQQGISPVDDLDEIAALWPVDDDPDEIIQHIITERTDRRRLCQPEEDN